MPLNRSSPYAELTQEQYLLIGRYVVEWANVEYYLSELLCRLLLTTPFLARTYATTLSSSQMQDALKEAIEIHRVRYELRLVTPELLDAIEKANSEITVLRSIRNRFAHFCWMRQSDEKIFGTRFSGGVPSAKRDRKTTAVLEVKKIEEMLQRLRGMTLHMADLIERVPEVREEAILKMLGGMSVRP